MIGGLVMAVLNNGLQLQGVGADMTQMIKGLVLLVAVAADVYGKTQGRPSIIGLLMRNFGSPAKADTTQTEAAVSATVETTPAATVPATPKKAP